MDFTTATTVTAGCCKLHVLGSLNNDNTPIMFYGYFCYSKFKCLPILSIEIGDLGQRSHRVIDWHHFRVICCLSP
jgi:hypothetical protein